MSFLRLSNDQGASLVEQAAYLSFFLVFKNFIIWNLFSPTIIELHPSILQCIHFYTDFIMSRFRSWSTMNHNSPYVVGFRTGLFSLLYSSLLKIVYFLMTFGNLFIYRFYLSSEIVFSWVFSLFPQRIWYIWNIDASKLIFLKVS